MKNLVIGYVHATKQKKTEVLHLIAKILDFTSAELEQAVGNERHSGWLSGLWNTASSGSKSPQVMTSWMALCTGCYIMCDCMYRLHSLNCSSSSWSPSPPLHLLQQQVATQTGCLLCWALQQRQHIRKPMHSNTLQNWTQGSRDSPRRERQQSKEWHQEQSRLQVLRKVTAPVQLLMINYLVALQQIRTLSSLPC